MLEHPRPAFNLPCYVCLPSFSYTDDRHADRVHGGQKRRHARNVSGRSVQRLVVRLVVGLVVRLTGWLVCWVFFSHGVVDRLLRLLRNVSGRSFFTAVGR